MFKRKFIRATIPQTVRNVDWTMPIICQLNNDEQLTCTNKSMQRDKHDGSIAFVEALQNQTTMYCQMG